MSLTHFPHGLIATPNIGGSRLADIWNSENIFFVDGDNGLAGNYGKDPSSDAFSLPSAAVNAAGRGATIYIRPRNTAASAQSYYQDDIVIPLTKPNLCMYGCVPDRCTGAQSGPQFKPLTVTGHLIDVKGANFTIESLRLTLSGGTADQNKCIIHAVHDVAGTQIAAGMVVRGCRFENDKSKPSYSSTEAVASIGLGSTRDVIIEGNTFYNCIGGIAIQETSGIPHQITIRNNEFSGPVSVRDCDILASWGNGVALNIIGNVFSDGLPNLSTGAYKKFIVIIGAGTGIAAGNYFASTTASFGSSGSECTIPATFFFAGNYINDGLIVGA